MEKLMDGIMEILEGLGPYEIATLHNSVCEKDFREDDRVYLMDEFDEVMEGKEPWEIARACYYGNFRPCDTFFRFNGYGNIVSFDYLSSDNSNISLEEIMEYVINNNDSLDNEEIAAALNEQEN